jgi:hypothetical protein
MSRRRLNLSCEGMIDRTVNYCGMKLFLNDSKSLLLIWGWEVAKWVLLRRDARAGEFQNRGALGRFRRCLLKYWLSLLCACVWLDEKGATNEALKIKTRAFALGVGKKVINFEVCRSSLSMLFARSCSKLDTRGETCLRRPLNEINQTSE